jgi:hypothetical protein
MSGIMENAFDRANPDALRGIVVTNAFGAKGRINLINQGAF